VLAVILSLLPIRILHARVGKRIGERERESTYQPLGISYILEGLVGYVNQICGCSVPMCFVRVEIFTHGFTGMGPTKVVDLVRVLYFTYGYPLEPQKSCDLFQYSGRGNIFINAIAQPLGNFVSPPQLIK
jgi:hypothetical protein